MTRLFFIIWLFTTMKICQYHNTFAKISSKFCRLLKEHFQTAKVFINVPKWRNFAKSGHTAICLPISDGTPTTLWTGSATWSPQGAIKGRRTERTASFPVPLLETVAVRRKLYFLFFGTFSLLLARRTQKCDFSELLFHLKSHNLAFFLIEGDLSLLLRSQMDYARSPSY